MEKIKKLYEKFKETKLGKHIIDFVYIWIIIGLIVVAAALPLTSEMWWISKWIGYAAIAMLFVLLIRKPMNAVYGLMGATGDIRIFFLNFFLISLIFAGIYYLGFFRHAGISYDVNQPHIDYLMFADCDKKDSVKIETTRDTVYLEHIIGDKKVKEAVVHVNTEELHYQKIGFENVWKSTLLTTLTQEPVDLFTNGATYNAAMDKETLHISMQKANLLHWILILHIIIAWIFFGVFISLLYNKFRYES